MIRLVEGSHLTATNKRHIGQMIAQGMARGVSGPLSYAIEPLPDRPDYWRYRIAKRERDDWNRPVVRTGRGIIEHRP